MKQMNTCLETVLKVSHLLQFAGMGDVIPVKGRGSNPAQEHEGPQPYFDADVQRNVTAIATQTAFLHCRVKDLGVKVVSSFFG